MDKRIITAITGTAALSLAAALYAPAAQGQFTSYPSFKGKKQGQLKGDSKKANVSQTKLNPKLLPSATAPVKSTKGTPKVPVASPQINLPPHPP